MSKTLIYMVFAKEVGKKLSPSSGLEDVTLLHNLPYKIVSSEGIFLHVASFTMGVFFAINSPYRTDTPRPPSAPTSFIAVSPLR